MRKIFLLLLFLIPCGAMAQDFASSSVSAGVAIQVAPDEQSGVGDTDVSDMATHLASGGSGLILSINDEEFRLKSLVEKYPDSEKYRVSLSRLYLSKGSPELADKVLRPIIVSSRNWKTWFWFGTTQLLLGSNAMASKSLDASITLSKRKEALPYITRAIVAQESSKHFTAILFLRKALSLEKNNPYIYLNIAFSAGELGLRSEALVGYQKALDLLSDSPKDIELKAMISKKISSI